MLDFALPPRLEAHEPPARRDDVRLLAGSSAGVTHHAFTDLPTLLRPGDLLVVNNSATLPAAVRLDKLTVHFSTSLPDESWLVELRMATQPYGGGCAGEWFPMPGAATLTLLERATPRLWRARLTEPVVPYLSRYGVPIRYGYVPRDQPLEAYQTVFGTVPGSAEMPSAGRPFTYELVTRLVTAGVQLAPITLHTGVASPEKDEPPYDERYEVPATTARLVNETRAAGGRVIAIGTTVVRALETAVTEGRVVPSAGWTSHVVTDRVAAVDGLLTGLHEPRSSHLMMLTAIAGTELLRRVYEEALGNHYRWHEFGDVNLLLP